MFFMYVGFLNGEWDINALIVFVYTNGQIKRRDKFQSLLTIN